MRLATEAVAGPSSSMHEFIRVLPREAVDLPAMWDEADIEDLHYPHLEAEVGHSLSHVQGYDPITWEVGHKRLMSMIPHATWELLAEITYFLLMQIASEKQHWEDMFDGCSSGLTAMGINRSTFLWALTCARSRCFAGPHFASNFKVKLAAFAAVQAAIVLQAVVLTLIPGSGPPAWMLAAAEIAALALPASAVSDVQVSSLHV